MKGTQDSLELMDLITTKYQVRLDLLKLKIDAFKNCKKEPKCSGYFSESKAKILSKVFEILFEDFEERSHGEKVKIQDAFSYM